jgi:3-methyladenine DNA glycosylase AlkD
MAANEKTFGGAISEARKAMGWALKDLASHDIEHDRRSPSSEFLSK